MASGIHLKPHNAAEQTFHVTMRGVGTLRPFFRNVDKEDLLDRFRWYLSEQEVRDGKRRAYTKLYREVAVLAFCVLDNHFHLILHQFTANGMERLMRRVLTGYGRTYNANHPWKGPVFDARYAADPIHTPRHLREGLAYTILNNPIEQLGYDYSSNAMMLGERSSSWLRTDLALGAFGDRDSYREFMNRTGPARVERKLRRWGIDPSEHPYRPI